MNHPWNWKGRATQLPTITKETTSHICVTKVIGNHFLWIFKENLIISYRFGYVSAYVLISRVCLTVHQQVFGSMAVNLKSTFDANTLMLSYSGLTTSKPHALVSDISVRTVKVNACFVLLWKPLSHNSEAVRTANCLFEDIDCGVPPSVAQATCETPDGTTYNSVAHYTCHNHLVFGGVRGQTTLSAICQENGHWSDVTDICQGHVHSALKRDHQSKIDDCSSVISVGVHLKSNFDTSRNFFQTR